MDMYNPYIATDSSTNTWPNDGGLNDYEAFRPYLDELNNYIHTSATINNIPCARVYGAFNGPTGTLDPVTSGYISFDGLHPNSGGHHADEPRPQSCPEIRSGYRREAPATRARTRRSDLSHHTARLALRCGDRDDAHSSRRPRPAFASAPKPGVGVACSKTIEHNGR